MLGHCVYFFCAWHYVFCLCSVFPFWALVTSVNTAFSTFMHFLWQFDFSSWLNKIPLCICTTFASSNMLSMSRSQQTWYAECHVLEYSRLWAKAIQVEKAGKLQRRVLDGGGAFPSFLLFSVMFPTSVRGWENYADQPRNTGDKTPREPQILLWATAEMESPVCWEHPLILFKRRERERHFPQFCYTFTRVCSSSRIQAHERSTAVQGTQREPNRDLNHKTRKPSSICHLERNIVLLCKHKTSALSYRWKRTLRTRNMRTTTSKNN